MKHALFIPFIFLFASGSAVADYFTGNDLKMLMDSSKPQDIGMFRGYVAGVQDYNNGVLFCVHENVMLNQSSAIVMKYFTDNPQSWHLSAKGLVVRSLQKTFPCKN